MAADKPEHGELETRNITALLDRVAGGERNAFARLVEAVYADLRRIAAGRMAEGFHQSMDCLTMAPTGVVHEALIALMKQRNLPRNREHFFAIATRLIQRVVGDYRRQRLALKRGGGAAKVSIDSTSGIDPAADTGRDPLETGDAIGALESLHEAYPRAAEVMSLRVLCGHSTKQVAEMLDVSEATVERELRFAKAQLKRRLEGEAK